MMLNTDSQALNHLLFEGINAEDTPLHTDIEYINNAILICGKLRVGVEFWNTDDMRKMLDQLNMYLVSTLTEFEWLKEDFADMINEHFAAKKSKKAEGGQNAFPLRR